MNTINKFIIIITMLVSISIYCTENFIIENIYFKGLKNISLKKINCTLPFSIGDKISNVDADKIIFSLFATEKFDEIQVFKNNNNLIIYVKERPIISNIILSNEKNINSNFVKENLHFLKVVIGRFLNLEKIYLFQKKIEKFFFSMGKYNISIKLNFIFLPSNHIILNVIFEEKSFIEIEKINIIGNRNFNNQKLTSLLQIKEKKDWWNIKSSDKFERNSFLNNIENLKDFYLNQGFIKFYIDAIQVTMSPNKEKIYLNIIINEGSKYFISRIDIKSNKNFFFKRIKKKFLSKKNKKYNQSILSILEKNITKSLNQYGYVRPIINLLSEIDDLKKSLYLKIYIDVGKQFYIKKIYFSGDYTTKNVVLRREIQQLENSLYNEIKIENSREKINRGGLFEVTEIFKNISSVNDGINLIYKVKENYTGNFDFGLGYSNATKFNYQGNISENNILGTGNNVTISGTRNISRNHIELSYTYPYIDIKGIGFTNHIYYNNTKSNSTVYNYSDIYYGNEGIAHFLINKNNVIHLGLEYTTHNIFDIQPEFTILRYLTSIQRQHIENYRISNITLNYGWTFNTFDKYYFPTIGSNFNFTGKVTIFSMQDFYYKIMFNSQKYIPLNTDHSWILYTRNSIGYANNLQNNKELPFYENFFANGINTVRGFNVYGLGPTSMYLKNKQSCNKKYFTKFCNSQNGRGGNVVLVSSVELILPVPFLLDKYFKDLRTSLFFDTGTIIDNYWIKKHYYLTQHKRNNKNYQNDINHIRFSFGVSLQYLSPLGLLTFSYGKPIKIYERDQNENFQFNIGKIW